MDCREQITQLKAAKTIDQQTIHDLEKDLELAIQTESKEEALSHQDNAHTLRIQELEAQLGEEATITRKLQQELRIMRQEKLALAKQIKDSATTPKEESTFQLPAHMIQAHTTIYKDLGDYTQPPLSIPQCYQAYGNLNLLISHLPILKAGITLTQKQFTEIWNLANPIAKDTLVYKWAHGDLKLPLGMIELVTGSPPFFLAKFTLRTLVFIATQQATFFHTEIFPLTSPELHSYTHGQFHQIKTIVKNNQEIFDHAIQTLREEDISICYDAIHQHQWLIEHHPNLFPSQLSLTEVREYVTKVLEEKQTTISRNRLGTINSRTILKLPALNHPR